MACRGWLPSVRVALLGAADPRLIRMPGFVSLPGQAELKAGGFVAVELPEQDCLLRRLELPLSSDEDLRSAIQLEVETASPFPPEETRWGWRAQLQPDGGQHVTIAISSRALVQRALDTQRQRTPGLPPELEVWAPAGDGHVVLEGFEGPRSAAVSRATRRYVVASAAACVLAVLLAATPLLQKRLQVVQANYYLAAVSERAAPVLRIRDELGKLRDVAEALAPRMAPHANPIGILERITEALPDGAWLDHIEYTSTGVKLGGSADDAVALLQSFQAQPTFNNVRTLSPIVRQPRSGKDQFVFELGVIR